MKYVSHERVKQRVFMTVLEKRYWWWPWSMVTREYYSGDDMRAVWYCAESGLYADYDKQEALTGVYTATLLRDERLDAALNDRPNLRAIAGGKK